MNKLLYGTVDYISLDTVRKVSMYNKLVSLHGILYLGYKITTCKTIKNLATTF